MNKAWGFVYWGQLVDKWEDLPSRDGILNPGYKLEWENFQHDIVTDYLAWQAKIVNEYKRPDQFITRDFSGGVHINLDQWAIARTLDIGQPIRISRHRSGLTGARSGSRTMLHAPCEIRTS